MKRKELPAAGNNEAKGGDKGKDISKGSTPLPDKSPANIFLINKELNPMFGIPKEKNHEASNEASNEGNFTSQVSKKNLNFTSQKNLNQDAMKIVNEDMKENIKQKTTKLKRSVRVTGMMTGGFNFVKDAMKTNKGKK